MRQRYDLQNVYKGDTFDGVILELLLDGDPMDLTGATISMKVRAQSPTGTLVDTLTLANTRLTLLANILTIVPFLVTYAAGKYYYDIEIVFSDGRVKSYIGGDWTILQDTTY